MYRRLAVTRPEYYRRELAAALDNLGGRFRQAREFTRSLEVTEEALAIYRELLAAEPDLVLHDFLICLSATASRRARVGALRGLLDGEFFALLHARLPRHTLKIGLIHALHHMDRSPAPHDMSS